MARISLSKLLIIDLSLSIADFSLLRRRSLLFEYSKPLIGFGVLKIDGVRHCCDVLPFVFSLFEWWNVGA